MNKRKHMTMAALAFALGLMANGLRAESGNGNLAVGGWAPKSGVLRMEFAGEGETMAYASQECSRLLGRLGARTEAVNAKASAGVFVLSLGEDETVPSIAAVKHDGFAVKVTKGGVVLAAPTAKGVLNGVYTLAEEAGFAFVYPGEKGELLPVTPKPLALGERTVNPRFPYRGLFDSNGARRLYDYESWMAFLAKLRHNIYRDNTGRKEALSLCRRLGFRPEIGGHGMRDCLPRNLFEKDPELFRMFMPADFGGRRMKDSNFCIANPKTQRIVEQNFTKMVAPYAAAGYHAVHAWADDLPGNGWCMCPNCRSLEGSDQAQLAMNVEARAIRKAGYKMRVPAIAYHDTLFPATLIEPDPLCFFLYAPRERCWGHAIDDPSCVRNSAHLKALQGWSKLYAKNDDAHTFEYYSDKMLYRGHTPYLPDLLIGDAEAYAKYRIEAWMTLFIGGELLAPDWNLLAYSRLGWEHHTRTSLTQRLAAAFPEADRAVWCAYLDGYANAYQQALRLCEQPMAIYLDFRWMPERGGEVGRTMVKRLADGSRLLDRAKAELSGKLSTLSATSASFAKMSIARDVFQVTDLEAMAEQQEGFREIADWRNDADDARHFPAIRQHLEKSCKLVEKACDEIRPLVLKPGEQDNAGGFDLCYYLMFAKGWSIPELKKKITLYEKVFNAKDYGLASSVTPKQNAAAIQQAIDAAAAAGGGRVVVPAGEWITGTIWLKSKVELHLEKDCLVRMSPNQADLNKSDAYPENVYSFPGEGWNGAHLVIVYRCQDVAITGPGALSGNSEAYLSNRINYGIIACWPAWNLGVRQDDLYNTIGRPGHVIAISHSKNVRLEKLTVRDANTWTTFVDASDGVIVRDYTVRNNIYTGTSDGIDIECSRNVLVERADIITGDDGMTVRASNMTDNPKKDCTSDNVTFRDCTVWSQACGMRVGVGGGLIRNVTIENVRVRHAGTGFLIQSGYGSMKDFGVDFEHIRFRNCVVEDTFYNWTACDGGRDQKFGMKDIVFENCRFGGRVPRGRISQAAKHFAWPDIREVNCSYEPYPTSSFLVPPVEGCWGEKRIWLTYNPLGDGRSPSGRIILAQRPTRAARFAALELKYALRRVTGYDFHITTNDTAYAGARDFCVGVSARTSKQAKDFTEKSPYYVGILPQQIELVGLDAPDFDGEVALNESPKGVIKGRDWPALVDCRGTIAAVYTFIDQYLGVKWKSATETIYPKPDALKTVPLIEHRHPKPYELPTEEDASVCDAQRLFLRRHACTIAPTR